jgi:hypothetical protein
MHSAHQLSRDMFCITASGRSVDRDTLLDWSERDRLGIVVKSAYGGLGAGLLISLAITAFYDCPTRQRRSANIYPDHYVFHVGGPWGSHGSFDFWPEYKEVFVENDARQLLQAINCHGITHLALPVVLGEIRRDRHRLMDDAQDRIKKAFLYAAQGSVPQADVLISSSHENVLANFDLTLSPDRALAQSMALEQTLDPQSVEYKEIEYALRHFRPRIAEVSESDPTRQYFLDRLAKARSGAGWREEVRTVDVAYALGQLS